MLPIEVKQQVMRDIEARMGWPAGGAAGMRTWLGLPDPNNPPAPYVLASAAHDLPARQPTRSLVIATDYRSGSTLLADGLAGAGGYGIPLEYLQAGTRERRFARFPATSDRDYLDAVMAARTSASGVFGIKLFWPEASGLTALPDPLIVWLRRDDVVAQAVSTWTALVSGEWRTTMPSEPDVPYDAPRLTALVAMHTHHDEAWRSALREIPHIELTYEQLSADPVMAMTGLVTVLTQQGMAPDGPVMPPRLARQAGRTSTLLADRLRRDLMRSYPT